MVAGLGKCVRMIYSKVRGPLTGVLECLDSAFSCLVMLLPSTIRRNTLLSSTADLV